MRSKRIFFLFVLFINIPACSKLFAQSLSQLYPVQQNRKVSPGKTTYFIDPRAGSDDHKGTERSKPWKTFKRINRLILSPGDGVQVLSAGAFHESLALIAKGTLKMPVKVKFAPGRYDLYPDHALKKQLHISNTNDTPYQPKAIALFFDSCQFTTIEGQHTKFVLRGKMIETFVNNCTNIKLEGLSFDYNRPTVSELTVTNIGKDYADLSIHKDSKFSIQDSVLTWLGEGWSYRPDSYWQLLNLQTDVFSRIEIPMTGIRFVLLDKNKVRAYFRQKIRFEKGFIYQNRNVQRDCAGIFMQHSKNIGLKNIRIYFMHGMGVVSQFCENIKMDKVIVRPDEQSGKTCSAWADILHFSGCKGLVEISNSYLSAANDDAVNIHGTHLKIISIEKPNQIRLQFVNPQTFGFNPFSLGDSIDYINQRTLLPTGSNLVMESKLINDKEVLVTLKNTVSGSLAVNDAIENTTATPEVWIHHNLITRIPTRGILVTTRRKIRIEHNNFQRTFMHGIFVNDDVGYWFESGIVRELTISKNNFIQCGEAVICIQPETNEKVPVHQHISVLNNRFDLSGSKLFSANNTSNIKIQGNIIKTGKNIKQINELIQLQDCDTIEISGNEIVHVPGN